MLKNIDYSKLDEKVITSVDFLLHETFNPPNVVIKKPPFTVSRIGWGTFSIIAKVVFNEKLKLENKELSIPLSFSRDLTQNEETIFVDPNLLK